MDADDSDLDALAEVLLSRRCSRPVQTKTGDWVRCGSRVKSRCPSCAELYRGDWAAIARSGIFDGPVEHFRFYLLTLTAPSFGRVHRVPRAVDTRAARCGCGEPHTVADSGLRGVPLDPATYDYAGQVAWNRDAGTLWDRTRRRLRDRWDSLEYFIVREWQDRGTLHVHALLRVELREAPSAVDLGAAAQSAVAFSTVDGALVSWGEQSQCDVFRADGEGAKTVWYLSKALNYVMKDTARAGLGGVNQAWHHLAALDRAARSMRCSPDCVPANCTSQVHERHGARSHVVSASRRTKHRSGWSFTGLTRTLQRRLRAEWCMLRGSGKAPMTARDRDRADWARTRLADPGARRTMGGP